jgi:Amt family ammonium transporter
MLTITKRKTMTQALFTANNVWMLFATVLVFIMHLGFSTLEAGLVQRKNTVNILFKNAMIIAIGLLTYYIVGFNLMYPGYNEGGFFGFAGFGLTMPADVLTAYESGDFSAYADGGYTYWTDFIFQAMFAATAATIVSGAVAERIKLNAFLIFAVVFVAISYPITGMWKWGAGWLEAAGFHDFAGSTLVHAVGGWAALASVILLGARKGKYTENGGIRPIPGHSMPLAAVGVFLLWFGWFGFNGGSVLSADPMAVSLVFVTTALAGAGGAVGAFFAAYFLFKSHDLSMVLNGILGGLVGITAGADVMTPGIAIIIGLIAGVIIPFSVVFFDRIKIDDPVGATSVHLVCGVWGTLAVGLFGAKAGLEQLWIQLYGTLAVGAFTFAFAFGLMFILKKTIGIRVSDEQEVIGLDIAEHDLHAYAESMEEAPFGLSIK